MTLSPEECAQVASRISGIGMPPTLRISKVRTSGLPLRIRLVQPMQSWPVAALRVDLPQAPKSGELCLGHMAQHWPRALLPAVLAAQASMHWTPPYGARIPEQLQRLGWRAELQVRSSAKEFERAQGLPSIIS